MSNSDPTPPASEEDDDFVPREGAPPAKRTGGASRLVEDEAETPLAGDDFDDADDFD